MKAEVKDIMNYFIESQIMNMIAMAKSFEAGCEFAATKDDGKISTDEAALIQSVHDCTQRFIKDLQKIQKQNR